MNIIDAIKSGKRIKRSMWPEFKHYENHYGAKYTAREDILADDWEIESHRVTITREQFNKAWDKAKTDKWIGLEVQKNFCERDDLARELGL
jgi:hypothetical protein